MEIKLSPIGYIYTPFEDRHETPSQVHLSKKAKGRIEILDEYVDGLKDLERYSHITLIFYLDRMKKFELQLIPRKSNEIRGVFSTRSPRRPNHIGMSIIKLLKIEKNIIYIEGIDVLNKTPLLDIKPYIFDLDVPES